jgi:hypothetical protein
VRSPSQERGWEKEKGREREMESEMESEVLLVQKKVERPPHQKLMCGKGLHEA